MRILFSCTASEGHFRPLVPLARACVDAGHDVVFATAGAFGDRVGAAGFAVLAAGLEAAELEARHAPYREQMQGMPAAERRPFGFSSRFAIIDAPAKLAALGVAARDWQPELIVHEPADLAAPIVAAVLAVPSIHHSHGRLIPRACHERATIEIGPLWRSQGLEPEPLCGVFRGRYIDICPPSLQSESVPDGVHL